MSFDYKSADSQGTLVEPINPKDFDIDEYCEYESLLLDRCRKFWEGNSGVLVYRRFRVPEVFSYGCRDMKRSFELQLAALKESMKYKADIPNFLEPWYGIGTVASAFGADYIWNEGQAPATKTVFASIKDALNYEYRPVESTSIGKHVLDMIEYFLDNTKGKLPMSLSDVQSPLNIASYLVNFNTLFLDMYDDPEGYMKLQSIITDLLIEFNKKQAQIIGDALAAPGHGFASSREFSGIGLSDDNSIMISNSMYEEYQVPYMEKIGHEFQGTAFHSCGNWSKKIPSIKKIRNLTMVDGAFSPETDPDPNPLDAFTEAFVNTGIVLNARIVGDVDTVTQTVKKLWKPGMKLIVVTYCKTPEEQEQAYDKIHSICV